MTPLISPALEFSGTRSADANSAKEPEDAAATEIRQRFEQMLWAEMLSHAGLEKAFTQGGGEAASAFSRYVVEEIARDLAEQHPMGIAEKVNLDPRSARTPMETERS